MVVTRILKAVAKELIATGVVAGVFGIGKAVASNPNVDKLKKAQDEVRAIKKKQKEEKKANKQKQREAAKAFKETRKRSREIEAALYTLQKNGVYITPEMLASGKKQQPVKVANNQDQGFVDISPEEVEHDIKMFNELIENQQKAEENNADDILENYMNIGA